MSLFIPPNFNPLTAIFFDFALPGVLKLYQNIEDIVVSDEDKKMLRSLKNERMVFFTNHPSQAEPLIAYHITNLIGDRFNIIATRRAFDELGGFLGKLYQGLGCFSVVPGIADRESFKMTRSAISKPKGKLILFPEGEPMCGENDNLMPFQRGIAQLSLWGLEDALKNDSNADVVVLPGFIKYVFKATDSQILDDLIHSIGKIERKLGVDSGDRNLLRRFLMVGRILLENAEKEYGIQNEPDADYNHRTGKLRHTMLNNIADKIGLDSFDKDADAIQKLRVLFATIELIELKYPSPKVPKINDELLDWAKRECVKTYDLIVIKRDYLLARPTPERFYEYLNRYESIVMGRPFHALGGGPSHLPRKAHVSFAKPFKLSEFYSIYKQNREKGLDRLLERIHDDMQRLLNNTDHLTRNIIAPFDLENTRTHDFH
jgi:hypothetical protein